MHLNKDTTRDSLGAVKPLHQSRSETVFAGGLSASAFPRRFIQFSRSPVVFCLIERLVADVSRQVTALTRRSEGQSGCERLKIVSKSDPTPKTPEKCMLEFYFCFNICALLAWRTDRKTDFSHVLAANRIHRGIPRKSTL